MRYIDKWLIGLLVTSIVVNIILVATLNSKIDQQRHDIEQSLRSDLYQINQSLDRQQQEIREQEQWVQDIEFTPIDDKSSVDDVVLKANWSVREMSDGANVSLRYRPDDQAEWVTAETEETSPLQYTSTVSIDPENSSYEYQVISEGEMSQASEVRRMPDQFLRPIPLLSQGRSQETVDGQKVVEIVYEQVSEPRLSFQEVAKAVATVTYEDNNSEEILLKRYKEANFEQDNHHLTQGLSDDRAWILHVESEERVKHIDLRVEFKSGNVHEGQVYPSEQDYIKSFEKTLKQ
ncbi:hypothetical protein ABID56_001998 [Alkalibacillus flavidus]|uniref:Uncharacterized protein n=1 Tax=Alkalibacillus flavidus TaxID=546021 RepID=A0ABV2KXP2_9BACI